MTLLGKLARLDAAERRLLAEAALVVPLVRLALTTLPFRFVHRGVAALALPRPSTSPQPQAPERITRMVAAVAARVPRATCLTQALAAMLLLARHGYASTMRVGVAKSESGALRAHAWLETGGRTILGGPDPGAFVPFPPVAFKAR